MHRFSISTFALLNSISINLCALAVQIHQRVPLYIGSVEEVDKVEKFLA